MGSKTTSENTSNSSFSPPPQVMANYQAVTQQAQGVAATPYQGYGGPLVAGINGQQTTGINAVNSASGVQDPYNTGATGLASASTGAIDPTQFSPDQIQQYESPYQSDVINATEAQIQNQNQQQAASLRGNAISSGAFGGDRAGIAQAALAGQQDIANNATLANLNNQNYAQALGEFNTQQGVGLGAAQNTAQRQLAGAGVLGQLGQTAQGEALNEANAQTNAGTLQQTTQQAQDTAAYNQFLQQQAYPFETTGWLANIVEGIGSQSGGSSAGTTTTQGNAGSQVAGGLLGLASFLARGGRVPHRAAGGGIYLPQFFDPTTAGPTGIGGGQFVPAGAPLAVGHTMPTQGAPAPAAAPASPLTPQAVQAAGKGLKDAYGKMSAPSTPLTIDAAANAAPDALGDIDTGSMASLSDAGLGGIFARGGIVRPRFAGGGSPDGSAASGQTWAPTNMRTGAGGYSGPLTPRAAPMPVGNAKPAGAANYSVFPQQMSDGTWSTTQDVARGIAAPGFGGFADGGGIARRHYDGGGATLMGNVERGDLESYDLDRNFTHANEMPGRESLNVEDRRGDPLAAASPGVRAWPHASNPDVANAYLADINNRMGGKGPAWALSESAPLNYARGGIARRHFLLGGGAAEPITDDTTFLDPSIVAQAPTVAPVDVPTGIASPEAAAVTQAAQQTAQHNPGAMPPADSPEAPLAAIVNPGPAGIAADVPTPLVRPADLGAGDMNAGLTPEQAAANKGAVTDFDSVHGLDQNGDPVTAPTNLVGSAPKVASAIGGIAGSANPIEALKNNISSRIESGGNYQAIGPTTKSGDNAYGKYQVMGANIPSWTKEILGKPMTPAQFLADPKAQEAVATGKLGQYYAKTGSLPDTASMWFTGRPLAEGGAQASDINGMTGAKYAKIATAGDPLAYDSVGRQGGIAPVAAGDLPAADAVPAASGIAPPSATPTMQISAPQFPDQVPTPESGRTGLFGLNLSPETRQLMLSAGLGIAGAQGRSFLGNVGTGATAGIAAMRQNANLSSEAALRNTQTQGAAIENQMKSAQLKLMMDALNGHADAASSAAEGKPITAPGITAPGVTAGAAPPKQVDPRSDPFALRAQADRFAAVPAFKDRADRMYAQAAAIMSGDQQVQFTDGTTGYYPGVAEAKAKQAEAIASAQEAAKVPAALSQKSGEKNLDTQTTAKTAAYNDAESGQHMLSQATAMKNIMFDPKTGQPNINSGPMGPHIATVAALLEQAGVSPKVIKTFTGTNPDDAQALEKLRTSLGSESARADLPGSQVRVAEFQRYLQSVPSSEILPAAMKYMIDTAIIPKAQQQIGAYETVKNMDPLKDNIQDALFEYRKTNPWYKGGSTQNAAAPAPAAAPTVTPEAARAELARRAALKQHAAP